MRFGLSEDALGILERHFGERLFVRQPDGSDMLMRNSYLPRLCLRRVAMHLLENPDTALFLQAFLALVSFGDVEITDADPLRRHF